MDILMKLESLGIERDTTYGILENTTGAMDMEWQDFLSIDYNKNSFIKAMLIFRTGLNSWNDELMYSEKNYCAILKLLNQLENLGE